MFTNDLIHFGINTENIKDYNNRNQQARGVISIAYSLLPWVASRGVITKQVKRVEQGQEVNCKVAFVGVENGWILLNVEKSNAK